MTLSDQILEENQRHANAPTRAWGGSSLASPPPAGWRLNPFEDPHLKNQLIRRQWRTARRPPTIAPTIESPKSSVPEFVEHQANLDALKKEFRKLADKWREDTAFSSMLTQIVLHPAYQRIIGMGPDVLPLILDELQGTLGHWFWALEAIAGVDPIPEEDRGDVEQMAARWIRWGQDEGLID